MNTFSKFPFKSTDCLLSGKIQNISLAACRNDDENNNFILLLPLRKLNPDCLRLRKAIDKYFGFSEIEVIRNDKTNLHMKIKVL